ncbi:MAG: hypothetical protein GX627_02660 [Parcubacteria group bacterium]|jgi:hypothetical protein|nr:hypothetical protein [Parcubacteria group bacterium]
MKYEQNIPFYITKFKDYPWKKYESAHYIFHVKENSLAEKEIEIIKTRQESAYTKITQTLELKEPDQKIKYYFYLSRDKKAELMGDDWYGQSIYKEFEVHAVYNEQDKVIGEHEDTHLLSLQLGMSISFFQEGLAEAMVGKSMFGNEHNVIIKERLGKDLVIDISSLMSQQGWLDTPDEEAEFYYSIAGSFIKYLLDNMGLQKFKELYRKMERGKSAQENIKIFEEITGCSLKALEDKWIESLSN